MIHIYTGNGKGKSTSSFGLAMRASGQGLKVIIFQFLKPKSFVSGEEKTLKKIKGIRLVKFNQTHPMFKTSKRKDLRKIIKGDFEKAKKAVLTRNYDMVILDEIINVLDQSFIDRDSFVNLLKRTPEKVELVLTGRGDISDIEKYADYVTIMADKKHPIRKGTLGRKGIEY